MTAPQNSINIPRAESKHSTHCTKQLYSQQYQLSGGMFTNIATYPKQIEWKGEILVINADSRHTYLLLMSISSLILRRQQIIYITSTPAERLLLVMVIQFHGNKNVL